MNFEAITIQGWRSIGQAISIHPSNITVISGTNDSGKSAFLLATYFGLSCTFLDQADSWLDRFLFLEGSQHISPVTGAERINSEMSIIIKLDPNEIVSRINLDDFRKISMDHKILNNVLTYFLQEYNTIWLSISLKQAVADNPRKRGKGVDFEFVNLQPDVFDQYPPVEELFAKYGLNIDPYKCTEAVDLLIKVIKNELKNIKTTFIPNFRSINPYDCISYESAAGEGLGTNVAGILKFIETVCSEEGMVNGKYQKLLNYLKIVFPDVEGFSVNRPLDKELEKDIFVTWNRQGVKRIQPLSRSGSGIANTFYLVSRVLLTSDKLHLVLIDEPEIALHPRLQILFVRLLKTLSADFNVQWLLATHSPYLMKNLTEKDKLYLFTHGGIQTSSSLFDVHNKREVFYALGAFLPEALTSKGVIFVEGPTEVEVLSILLPKAGLDLENNKLLIIPLGGENLFHIGPRDLKQLHENIMVIIDSDLPKSPKSGGSVAKKKVEYEKQCHEVGIEIHLNRNYRYIENMYPNEILSRVLGISTVYGNYDRISNITEDTDKIAVGKRVANEMSQEQAKNFPYVESILSWWKQIN
jgi:AAA15 family ATPase/GTPase